MLYGGFCNGVILIFNYFFYVNLWFFGKKEMFRNDYVIGIFIILKDIICFEF